MASSAARLTTRWLTASVSSGYRSGRFLIISSGNGGVCPATISQTHRAGTAVSLSSWTRGNAVTLRELTGVRCPHGISCCSFHSSSRLANKQDLYEVLGVSRTASQKEIKKGMGFGNINSMFEERPEFVMELTFSEAAKGVNKELSVNIDDTCQRCDGRGNEPGTKVSHCHYCNGTGMESISTGPFMMRSTCRRCGGKGSIINTPCALCRGSGQTKKRQTVTVPVPAGVDNGQTVRMSVGTKEILITFRVQRSPVFRRSGVDIHSDAFISIAQAVLGGTATTQGLYETISIVIPAGCQADQIIRLQGKGIRRINSYSYGDHYVHIKIKVPKKLTRRQRSLLLSYAEEETEVQGTVSGVSPSGGGGSSTSSTSTKSTASEEEQDKQKEKEEEGGFFSKLKKMFS
ncbi:dnaJ homolog subfamily A member 3, mitochondrial-like [Neolamprologus brichardi]|uniref:dnaJ homolog subfamily A member 3, mitochondrial-like n=1 Tax=Neolamprologus brichardi TaxID=32507 RepID=UPI0003EC0AC0|nr:dnaJ homolog subfamily A member 3, mitochondrial-like [Neolamprologus brichardi]